MIIVCIIMLIVCIVERFDIVVKCFERLNYFTILRCIIGQRVCDNSIDFNVFLSGSNTAVSLDKYFSRFQSRSAFIFRVKQSKKSLTLKALRWFETSGNIYPTTQRNITEDLNIYVYLYGTTFRTSQNEGSRHGLPLLTEM
jgi:hypothetical protein